MAMRAKLCLLIASFREAWRTLLRDKYVTLRDMMLAIVDRKAVDSPADKVGEVRFITRKVKDSRTGRTLGSEEGAIEGRMDGGTLGKFCGTEDDMPIG